MKKYVLFLLILLFSPVITFALFCNETILSFYTKNNSEIKVTLYPNPLNGKSLTITSEEDFTEVEILSILGKVVFNKKFDDKTSETDLDLDKLDKGMYIIRIIFNDQNAYLEKLIVQ